MSADPLLADIVRLPLDSQGAVVTAAVPCGGCRRCCQKNSIVMLLPQHGDIVESYEHDVVDLPGAGSGPILKRKPNGDCHYLGADGCSIHDRAPAIRRMFDCRGAYRSFLRYPRKERKRMIARGYIDKDIFERGRELYESEER